MESNTVYIIIINWNSFFDTKECIESLLKIKNMVYKIILIDNGSQNYEGKRLKAAFPMITLIGNKKNEGFCRASNTAISFCLKQEDCGYIMILNNDTVVRDNFLDPLIDYLDNNPQSIVSPQILYFSKPDFIQTMGGRLFFGGTLNIGRNKKIIKFLKVISPDYLSGACLVAKKEVFEEVGLFDEKFFAYGEDLDWSLRAKKKNFRLFTLPESKIYHKHSQSTKGSYLKVFLIARNYIYFARKHLKGFKKYKFILSSILVGFFINVIRYKNPLFLKHFVRGVKDGLNSAVNH